MKKHILCFGDSNTHGSCTDPLDSADGGSRFNEDERWTQLLQQKLGSSYLVIEEGLPGRTTVFPDPLDEGMCGLDAIYGIMKSHQPIDLLVIMLGTNDIKQRYQASAYCVALGLERLINKAKVSPFWGSQGPNILVICPPHIGEGILDIPLGDYMGADCVEKSRQLDTWMRPIVQAQGCAYLDGNEFGFYNQVDFMHMTRQSHRQFADRLAEIIPTLV